MSDPFVRDTKQKIEDLQTSLSLSNHKWNEWEYDFIESVSEKLLQNGLHVTVKQYEKICDLWEKI